MSIKIQKKHLTVTNKDGTIAEVPAIVSSINEAHADRHSSTGTDPITPDSINAVPNTRTINNKALTNDITLDYSDVNALPDTTVIPTVPTNLSEFTDDLGTSPTHIHSQYLPLSGGTMTGLLVMGNKEGYNKELEGGEIHLKAPSDSYYSSVIDNRDNCTRIFADGSPSHNYVFEANHLTGELKWNSKNVSCIDSSSYSSGNGWIRYTNGLQMCWGTSATIGQQDTSVTFAIAFISAPNVSLTRLSGATTTTEVNFWMREISATAIKVYNNVGNITVYYFAIGWWK